MALATRCAFYERVADVKQRFLDARGSARRPGRQDQRRGPAPALEVYGDRNLGAIEQDVGAEIEPEEEGDDRSDWAEHERVVRPGSRL